MKANCWMGKRHVSIEDVPDPRILNSTDAIIRTTSTAICGSDLHLYNGMMPSMQKGDIVGHEFMGEVVEVGPAVKTSGGRSRGCAIPYRVRQVCGVSEWIVLNV